MIRYSSKNFPRIFADPANHQCSFAVIPKFLKSFQKHVTKLVKPQNNIVVFRFCSLSKYDFGGFQDRN